MPGAALGGYLGAQTGSGGANGVDAWDKYYYHFSDLGTVLATTDGDGAMLGVYQPDFWGNYRETSGTRPDTMGLTGKFYDEDVDLYYFNARWYDPERGLFISQSPLSPIIEHQYAFNHADLANYADPSGLWEEDVHRDDTYDQCIKTGGNKCTCQKIADADEQFDHGWTNPWKNSSLHFPQTLAPIGGKLLNAINSCDIKAFGSAHHQYQDYFAHVYPGNAGSNGFKGLTRPNHFLQLHDPDNVLHHPKEWELTINSTFNWIRKFMEKCGNRSGPGGNDCSECLEKY